MKLPSQPNSKVSFFVFVMLLFTTLSMIALVYITSRSYFKEQAYDKLRSEADLINIEIMNSLETIAGDLVILSRTPPIEGILRSVKNKGIDRLDNSTLEIWKARLSVIFSSLLDVRDIYTQIRYIGVQNNGMEIVRVNRSRGDVVDTTDANLQNKSKEPYYIKGVRQSNGSVMFSSISYNREHGKIVYPLEPTLRVLIPIHDGDEKIFGLLVINVDYAALLRKILQNTTIRKKILLYNDDGDFFQYDSPTKTLKFYDHDKYKLSSAIKSVKEGENEFWVSNVIYSNSTKTTPILNLILSSDKKTMSKHDYLTTSHVLVYMFFIALLSCLLTFFILKFVLLRDQDH